MTRTLLKSTTAIALSLSMAMPHAALAQADAAAQSAVDCAALSEEERAAANCEGTAEGEGGGLLGDVGNAVEDVVDDVADAAEEGADTASDVAEDVVQGAEDAAEAVEDAVEDAQETSEDTAEGADPTADAAADGAAAGESDMEADVAADADAANQADPGSSDGAGADAAVEAEAVDQDIAETAPESGVSDMAEDTAAKTETPPAETPSTQDIAEDLDQGAPAGEATQVAEPEAEAEAEPEPEVQAEAEPEPKATEAAESQAEPTEQANAPVPQDDTAETTAAANKTVDAQATSQNAEAAEVTTETVTEDSARTSDESFESQAPADAAAQSSQQNQPAQQGQQGLSTFEQFAIGALGVLAVGTILNNGAEVVSNTGDRAVARRDNGDYYIIKDDNTLLRRPGTQIETRTFSDGSTETVATRENGVQIRTIRAADGRILRRTRILPDGQEVLLIDDTRQYDPVELGDLPQAQERTIEVGDSMDDAALREALRAASGGDVARSYSLNQVRNIRAVRALVPELQIDAINFQTGSAVIQPTQAEELRALGVAMRELIAENPGEVFLIEGHTDAVGSAAYNLTLSDRRAESVALALTEYFDVSPENMVIQGYGESALKVRTQEAERANRRATVRRITPLLQTAARAN